MHKDGGLGQEAPLRGGPRYAAFVCAVSVSKMLLADNSESPFLERYRTPQTSLWEMPTPSPGHGWCLGPEAPSVPKKLPGLPLPPAPVGPGQHHLCAVQGASLREAISLVQRENDLI